MNVLSYDLAVQLKEAGFPQPTPKKYQIWYGLYRDVKQESFLVYAKETPGGKGVYQNHLGSDFYKEELERGIYAPTAEEIMIEIPNISPIKITPLTYGVNGGWSCSEGLFGITVKGMPTAVEAAAQLYLEIKKNKPGA